MVKYRQAIEKDYKSINDFYNRIYSSNRTLKQFYWEFHNCPCGKSIYIIAEDGEKIVGTNCVIPIELINSNKQIILTGKSEDTLVDPDYRGQNIFYNLYQLLFEKCIEHDIKVVWGFTSAYKPFKKLGFDIPYEHQQNLVVNKIFSSYIYLSGLNKNNILLDRMKIFGLCIYSKLKFTNSTNSSVLKRFHISRQEILEQITDLIHTNLNANEDTIAIHQSPEFQKWRIYQNPNYHRVHTFGFYDKNDRLKGLIVVNSHPDKIAYISHSIFHAELKQEEIIAMITYTTKEMFKDGITLIRNWLFDHNSYNTNEIELYKRAKYTILNRGIGLVWKELQGFQLNPKGFHLSRIATQGVI